MSEPVPPQEQDQTELNDSGGGGVNKRKYENAIELAKQKAQEIALRLVNDAEPKRFRLGSDTSSDYSLASNPVPNFPVSNFAAQSNQYLGLQAASKKISIPNGKVGVVIGKGGETIKYIQMQSGAKVQITKDQEADPNSLSRDVELMGTSEQISQAEQLINDVISETDAGGLNSSSGHGASTKQPGAEQFSMSVPNDKVGLLIGKGGETIKYMQTKSGARMQIIPLHLPPGDTSTERTVYIDGSTEEIEEAKRLVNDVLSGKRIINSSASNSYAQPSYSTSGNWAQPGQPPLQQPPQYAYAQPVYPPAPHSYYGYSTQQPAWDQSNQTTASQTPQQYNYYGQQHQVGSTDFNHSYSYAQTPAVANSMYDHGYGQHPPSYGQNISSQASTVEHQQSYAASNHGTQSTQPASTYPPAYGQTYWNSSGYTGQVPQTGYDQTGYSQAAYEGVPPPPSDQATYGQGGEPSQPTPPPVNYAQGTHFLPYGQAQEETPSQSQPQDNLSQVQNAETHDGNSNPDNGSEPPVKGVASES